VPFPFSTQSFHIAPHPIYDEMIGTQSVLLMHNFIQSMLSP